MKQLPLLLNLLLCILVTRTMQPCAAAVEMISVQQALNQLTKEQLSDSQTNELVKRLQLCADENNLISPETAYAVHQHLIHSTQQSTTPFASTSPATNRISTHNLSLYTHSDLSFDENYTTPLLANFTPSTPFTTITNTAGSSQEDEKEYDSITITIISDSDQENINKLYDAYDNGNINAIKKMLQKGICPTILDHVFAGCILYTQPEHHISIIQLLLDHDANPNVVHQHEQSNNIFKQVFLCNTDRLAKMLILAGLRLNHKNKNGHTILGLTNQYAQENNLVRHQHLNTAPIATLTRHHILSVMATTLQQAHDNRKKTDKVLSSSTTLPCPLILIICDYANLFDRNEEIASVEIIQQSIEQPSRANVYCFHTQRMRNRLRHALQTSNRVFAATCITNSIASLLISTATDDTLARSFIYGSCYLALHILTRYI